MTHGVPLPSRFCFYDHAYSVSQLLLFANRHVRYNAVGLIMVDRD